MLRKSWAEREGVLYNKKYKEPASVVAILVFFGSLFFLLDGYANIFRFGLPVSEISKVSVSDVTNSILFLVFAPWLVLFVSSLHMGVSILRSNINKLNDT